MNTSTIMELTEISLPIEVHDGEIDWLEMTKPPKEFRSHTCAPLVRYGDIKPRRISDKTETLVQ